MIEKSYLAISGQNLRANEIIYLLSFFNPSQMPSDYAFAKGHIKYENSDRRINYKSKYEDRNRRKWIKRRNLSGYFVSGSFAGAPTLFAQSLNFSGAVVLGVLLFGFGSLAWLCLRILGSVEAAERVMKEEFKRRNTAELEEEQGVIATRLSTELRR